MINTFGSNIYVLDAIKCHFIISFFHQTQKIPIFDFMQSFSEVKAVLIFDIHAPSILETFLVIGHDSLNLLLDYSSIHLV